MELKNKNQLSHRIPDLRVCTFSQKMTDHSLFFTKNGMVKSCLPFLSPINVITTSNTTNKQVLNVNQHHLYYGQSNYLVNGINIKTLLQKSIHKSYLPCQCKSVKRVPFFLEQKHVREYQDLLQKPAKEYAIILAYPQILLNNVDFGL